MKRHRKAIFCVIILSVMLYTALPVSAYASDMDTKAVVFISVGLK